MGNIDNVNIWISFSFHSDLIKQKGMTFDDDFCLFILLSFFPLFQGGREKGKRTTKVVDKSHAFLLDLQI
jgi:hypothetical protein